MVHLAAPAFAADAPYQVVIVTLENGSRITGRTDGELLRIGDTVERSDARDGVPYFRKLV